MISKSLTLEDQAELQAINAALVPTDPWLYLTEYVVTKDEHDTVNPYKKFPRKLMYRVILRATEEYNNLFIEKSRQIMLTWIMAALYLHDAMYNQSRNIMFQSKKQEDANDVIERCRVIYDHLVESRFPGLPIVESTGEKSGQTTKMKFPSTKSTLRAIPQGGNIVRSQTLSRLLGDEIAFQPEASASYKAAMPSINGGGRAVWQSTPHGRVFNWMKIYAIDPETGYPKGKDKIDSARIREPAYTPEQLLNMDNDKFDAIPFAELVACVPGMRFRINCDGIAVLRVHYSADPDKSPETTAGKEWIAAARAAMSEEDWEQEMEINYDSFSGRPVIPKFQRDIFVKSFEYDPSAKIYMGIDFGSEVCVACFAQYLPIVGYDFRQVRFIDEIMLRNSDTVTLAKEILTLLKVNYENAYSTRNFRAFPDPAGMQRRETTSDKSQNTSIKILNSAGIPTKVKKLGVPESTDFVRSVFRQTAPDGSPAVVIHPRCDYLIRCLSGGWRYPETKGPGQSTGHPDKDGEFDHGGDTVRHLISNVCKIEIHGKKRFQQPKYRREEFTGRIIGWER